MKKFHVFKRVSTATLTICAVWVLLFLFTSDIYGQKAYKGGEIQSKQLFLYGKFEFRMYCASGSGQLSTFYLYKPGSEKAGAANRWEEVDIEAFGKNEANCWQSNIITEDWNGNNLHRVEALHYGSFHSWHTFLMEWTPNYIKWYVDGTLVRNFTDMSVLQYLTNPEKICFNSWTCNIATWVGNIDNNSFPGYQYVQYIKHFPWDGNDFSANTDFFDDFNNLNNFSVSTWTFNENAADFATSNAGIVPGTNTLCLANTLSNAGGIAKSVPEDNLTSVTTTSLEGTYNLSVFPNPSTDGLFTISLKGYNENENVCISITDLKGNVVYSKSVNMNIDGFNKISINNLMTSGIYIVSVKSKDRINYQKIVLNKLQKR